WAGCTNHTVLLGGKRSVTTPPGSAVWSDGIDMRWPIAPATAEGRKLAVSFHIAGTSGPMTWHAKALQTSYVSRPGSPSVAGNASDAAFPFSTTSWYFLDGIDVVAPAVTRVVCAFGDSITDGAASTINGDDRWPDDLSRRLHAAYWNRVSVVNAGIGGHRILAPPTYTTADELHRCA